MPERTTGPLLLATLTLALAACASTPRGMEVRTVATCHGEAAPFSTFTLSFEDVPGFIETPIATAAEGALLAIGLDAAATPAQADLNVVSSFSAEDRNPPPQPADPMGEPVQTATVNRFVAHLKVDVVDQRTGSVIWTGSMHRDHAVSGGETFHNDRAVLLIRDAFDEMFVGLTRPCG
ncbi:MAG: hypothetical protein AB7I04_16010 [Pseudomonadales bacterium]